MYTYAFLKRPSTPLDLPAGIAGSLQLLVTAHLSALIEPDLDFESLQQSDHRLMQAVLYHDRIIQDIFNQTPVLPLRFGTRFVSEEALLDHLESHNSEYLEKLANLVGKAEYTLKLTPIDSPDATMPINAKGKDYFLAKKQRYQMLVDQKQQRQDELNRLKAAIAQLYPNLVHGESKDAIERIYLLIDSEAESLLLESLQTWRSQCPHWHLELGDPLPPYHFV
jgi:Gas vesicle synthesis protein GvpL/GvpF